MNNNKAVKQLLDENSCLFCNKIEIINQDMYCNKNNCKTNQNNTCKEFQLHSLLVD